MEVVDPFVPSFEPNANALADIPEDWALPYASTDVTTEPALDSFPAFGVDVPEMGPPTYEHGYAVDAQVFATEESAAADSGFGETETVEPEAPHSLPADDGIEKAKAMTQQLACTLQELQATLAGNADERFHLLEERSRLRNQIRSLEEEGAKKERFKAAMLTGPGASLSNDDLEALQSMTDALTQDPDRLTLLFNVVQQAPKLATAVNVFTQLRRMAEEF